jgi:predicted DNA-binding transcriptional regulator
MKDEFIKVNFELFNLSLNPSEIIIYAYLKSLSTIKGFAFPTNDFLVKKFNGAFSESTIKRTIKKLKKEGLINVENKTSKIAGTFCKQRKIYINNNNTKTTN